MAAIQLAKSILKTAHRQSKMSFPGVFVAAAFWGFLCPAFGQNLAQPDQHSSDREREFAVIGGRVLNAETGIGLPKATVALYSVNTRRSWRPLAAKTNDEGEYQILDVPPGRYRIFGTRTGFVRQSFSRNPSHGTNSAGTPVAVRPGQVLPDIDFYLIPGGVIEGQVFDTDYDPLSRVKVSLQRVRTVGGKRTLASVANASTDDRGLYRLFGIPPGRYYLSATYRPFEVPRGEKATPVPTYYPGVASPQQATEIDVHPGAQYTGADMVLVEARSYSLSGTLVDPEGSPLASVRVHCRKPAGEGWAGERAGGATTDTAGNFEVMNLVPGEYLLSASSDQAGGTLLGSAAVTVSNRDVRGSLLVLGNGAEIQGKIVAEGSDAELDPREVSLHVVPEEIIPPVFMRQIAEMNEDSTFQISQIPPGSARLTVSVLPGNFYPKSIRFRGMDVVDRAFSVNGSDRITRVEVVVSPEGAQLAGVVEDDETGEATPGATVVIFSSSRAKRTAHSRFTRTTQADQDGNFSLSGIVPGEYVACAVINHEAGAEDDPSYLSAMEKSCERVELGKNATHTETLVAIPLASY